MIYTVKAEGRCLTGIQNTYQALKESQMTLGIKMSNCLFSQIKVILVMIMLYFPLSTAENTYTHAHTHTNWSWGLL